MPSPIPSNKRVFDVAVIGGGIAGAAVLRDAQLRGLQSILFEKKTFGSGTSSKSSNLIHGGLRYLETAWRDFLLGRLGDAWENFRFVSESLKECSILTRTAPGLIEPIPLLIPVYSGRGQNRWLIFAGAILYGVLGRWFGSGQFPKILFDDRSVLALEPLLDPCHLTGGIMIWDHTTDDRALVEAIARSAKDAGALALEFSAVKTWKRDGKTGVYEIQVETNGVLSDYRSRVLVNAGGPWIDQLRRAARDTGPNLLLPVAGSHLTFKQFLQRSVILQASDERIIFVINRDGHSRVGTTERRFEDPDRLEVTEADIEYLLSEANRFFPQAHLTRQDIVSQDAGIRPLALPKKETNEHFVSREHAIGVSSDGVYHLIGVKLTDHRRAAAELLDRFIRDHFSDRKDVSKTSFTDQRPL